MKKGTKIHRSEAITKELAILQFMYEDGDLTRHFHHGESNPLKMEIGHRIEVMLNLGTTTEFNEYAASRNSGDSQLPLSQLGCLWRHDKFPSIYDVPLDGTWRFFTYDSGERGLGAFNRISAFDAKALPAITKVYPGEFPPIVAD